MKNHLKVLCGAMAMALGGQVFAATWNLVGAPQDYPTAGVTISAYANTGGANSGISKVAADSQTIQSATWMGQTWDNGYYGGVKNTDACTSQSSGSNCDLGEGVNPEHAIDNDGRYDMVLLDFGTSSVKLTDLKLSWVSNDSDVTVMAYNGSGTPTLVGQTYGALTGWTLIGNYANVGTTSKTINAGGISSSFWLIGAYNPLAANGSGVVGGTTSMIGGSVDSSFDYVKLSSVTGCISGTSGCTPPSTGKVPEPGSLALLGVGIFGLMRMRRARQT